MLREVCDRNAKETFVPCFTCQTGWLNCHFGTNADQFLVRCETMHCKLTSFCKRYFDIAYAFTVCRSQLASFESHELLGRRG